MTRQGHGICSGQDSGQTCPCLVQVSHFTYDTNATAAAVYASDGTTQTPLSTALNIIRPVSPDEA